VRIERFCKGINICIAALSRICIASPYNPRAMCVLPLPLGDASDGRSTAHSRPKGDARPSVRDRVKVASQPTPTQSRQT